MLARTIILAIALASPAYAETLLVVTEGGTVSVVRDLDARTCKIAACKMRQQATCFPVQCDEGGNLIWPTAPSSLCMSYLSPGRPKTVECIK
jgi:hypothetical protein